MIRLFRPQPGWEPRRLYQGTMFLPVAVLPSRPNAVEYRLLFGFALRVTRR